MAEEKSVGLAKKNESAENNRAVIRNFVVVEDHKGKKYEVKVPLSRVAKDVEEAAEVRTLQGVPFVVNGKRIELLNSAIKLETWLEGTCCVDWKTSGVYGSSGETIIKPISWSNVWEHLSMNAERFEAIASIPHYPKRENTYYLRSATDYPEGSGEVLDQFVGLFNPASDLDRDLIKAFVVSPMWGGHPGTIPLFVFSSDEGVGVGKSSTVEAVGDVYGGCISTEKKDSSYELAVRMASQPERRLLLIDNVKGRQDSEKWESMITAKEVQLRRLNRGSYMTPNSWVWCLTANLCDLSTDLASRSVIIKIGSRRHGVDFKSQVADFLAKHREQLIADILALLQQADAAEIDRPTRWQAWERAVLAKLPNANKLCELIGSRRSGVDSDTEDALEVRSVIEQVLRLEGWEPSRESVLIPTSTLLDPIRECLGRRSMTTSQFWSYLSPLFRMAPLTHCEKTRKSIDGKQYSGLLWRPDPNQRIYGWDAPPPREDAGVLCFPSFPSFDLDIDAL